MLPPVYRRVVGAENVALAIFPDDGMDAATLLVPAKLTPLAYES